MYLRVWKSSKSSRNQRQPQVPNSVRTDNETPSNTFSSSFAWKPKPVQHKPQVKSNRICCSHQVRRTIRMIKHRSRLLVNLLGASSIVPRGLQPATLGLKEASGANSHASVLNPRTPWDHRGVHLKYRSSGRPSTLNRQPPPLPRGEVCTSRMNFSVSCHAET